jgi:hypothetical protein
VPSDDALSTTMVRGASFASEARHPRSKSRVFQDTITTATVGMLTV